MKASWRTSIFGAGGLLTIIVNTVSMLMDGNPATNPDWSIVFAAAMPALGLLFARDEQVTSKEVGLVK